MKYRRRKAIQKIGSTFALSLLSKSAYARLDDSTAGPRIRIGQIGVGHAHANKNLTSRRFMIWRYRHLC